MTGGTSVPRYGGPTGEAGPRAATVDKGRAPGGACVGDSGGPTLFGTTNQVVAVTSFGLSPSCTGTDDEYRIDRSHDLAFLAGFGVTP